MPELLRLFVSATTDLEAERATIGRSIAELPIQIGIEIRRSPVQATFDEIFERLSNVDRVYFLIGNDITAPAGLEWHLAWRLERSILPIRRSPRPTPAAQEFFHLAPLLSWLDFRTQRGLARIISLDVARILKHPANRYGLTVPELERLEHHSRTLEVQSVLAPQTPGGAEGGGVLLDAGHRQPLHGVELTD